MSLQDQAMLVRLSLPKFGLNRHDDDAAKDVAQRNGADSKAVAVTKRLLQGNKEYDAIRKFDEALRKWNREQTVPWNDKDDRLLPTLQYDLYMSRMRQARPERERLVREFMRHYDDFARDDRASLCGLYRAADYPDRLAVEGRFKFIMDVQPVPNAKDFRVAVGKADLLEMEKNVAAQVVAAEQRARTDLFGKLAEPIFAMAEKLNAENLTLRTTNPLVENLRDILDLIPRLNIIADPKLEELRQRALADLSGITPETLKDNDLVRTVTIRKAQAILDEMADFMGPPTALADAA